MKRWLCLPLVLTLTVACGTSPNTATSGPSLRAQVTPQNPCDLSFCQWNDLGPQPVGTNVPEFPSLVFTQNLPMVAWTRAGNGKFGYDLLVQVKTGATWEPPQQLNDAGSGNGLTLTQDPSGVVPPLAAFQEDRSNGAVIRLKSRTVVNGASVWKPFDAQSDTGLGTPSTYPEQPSAVTTPSFTAVAWQARVSGNDAIFVWIKQGGVWRNLGTQAGGSLDFGRSPHLAVDANHHMVLTYRPWDIQIGVRTWNGSNFIPVSDPIPDSIYISKAYGLGITSQGLPVVAINEIQNSTFTLIVRQLMNNGQWTTLGTPLNLNASDGIGWPSLVVSGTTITVAFEEDGAGVDNHYVKRWNPASQTWALIGGPVSAGNSGGYGSLALDSNGNPLVAFLYSSTINSPYDLYVRNWSPPSQSGHP